MKARLEHQQGLLGVERVVLPSPGPDHQQRKCVSMDGGMVNIRNEGWKEFKVGAVYERSSVLGPTRSAGRRFC